MRKNGFGSTTGRVLLASLLVATFTLSPSALATDQLDESELPPAVAAVNDSVGVQTSEALDEAAVADEEPAPWEALDEPGAPEEQADEQPTTEPPAAEPTQDPDDGDLPPGEDPNDEPGANDPADETGDAEGPEEPAGDEEGDEALEEEEGLIEPMAAGPDGGEPPYVYWRVTGEAGQLVGGASFDLAGPRSSNIDWGSMIEVADCTSPGCTGPDLDPDPGEFLVKQISSHQIQASSRYRVRPNTAPEGYTFVAASGWTSMSSNANWPNQTYNFGDFAVLEGSLGNNQARLTIRKGGDRVGSSNTVTPLGGANFKFYRSTSSGITGGTEVAECTTDATGTCSVDVELGNGNNYFYVDETSAPSGWSMPVTWGSSSQHVRYVTGNISTGGDVATRIATLPGGDRTFPDVRDNPGLAQKCGLNIALVYDLSNSVTDSSSLMSQYKAAGVGFVDALEGTPSSIALYTFATGAPAAGANNTTLPLTSVAVSGDAVRNKINGLTATPQNAQGGTNWDLGLAQVNGSQYDAVIFLTDGNPTFRRPEAAGPGNSTTIQEVEEAIHSANKIKADTSLIVVGIGGSVTQSDGRQRLSLLSSDYHTTGFDTLGEKLKEIALKNCVGTLTVVKQILEVDGSLTPGAGWNFATPTEDVTPGVGITDANGALNFDIGGFDDSTTNRDVIVTETMQPGFSLEQQNGANAVCTNTDTGSSVQAQNQGELGFKVTVPMNAPISCRVVNKKYPGVTVLKSWVDGEAGDTAQLALTSGDISDSATSTVESEPTFVDTTNIATAVIEAGQVVNVSEVLATEAPYDASLSCNGVTVTPSQDERAGTFIMPSNNVTCTFTNTRKPEGHLTLVKELDVTFGGTATENDFGLTATSDQNEVLNFTSGQTHSVAPGDYVIGETLLPGYEFTGMVCTDADGSVPVAGMAVSVDYAQDVTCTLTNADLPGAVSWLKVDAADEESLLAGSQWRLVGPDGFDETFTDCEAGECTGLDKDPAAGRFRIEGLAWGDFILVEVWAPAGYQLDSTEHKFTINADHLDHEFDSAFVNNQRGGPRLPLTGGVGRDLFFILGLSVLGLGMSGGFLAHRRSKEGA